MPPLNTTTERYQSLTSSYSETPVLVIDTDPLISTDAGGHWWDVAVPEVSERPTVNAARKAYEEKRRMQSVGD